MTEKTIGESEKVFRELFNNMSSGVSVYEAIKDGNDFILKDLNKAGEDINKFKKKDVLGKILSELFPGVKEYATFFEVFKRVWKTGKSERIPTSLYKDERITIWVECYVYKLPSNRLVIMYHDVTEHKNTEMKLQKLNEELEQRIEERTNELVVSEKKLGEISGIFPDLFFLVDRESLILEYKGAEEDLYVPSEEFVGKRIIDVLPEKESKMYLNAIQTTEKTHEPNRVEYSLQFGKEIKHFEGRLHYLSDNRVTIFIRNITELKQAEKNVTESEEKYRKAYSQANLYKDIFAHDINNILQNIQSSVELSSLYINSPENLHTIKELYEIMNEQVNRGKKLIRNINKITEIDETDIELEKIESIRELNKAIEFTKTGFPSKNISIQVNNPPPKIYLLANNLLLDVFENILINAVRHNDKSNIEITIDINIEAEEHKNYVKFEFKDNGIGISGYRKKEIFEKGTRTSQKSQGMGLGLSLVKKIVDSFKGDIWVEDKIKGNSKQGCNFVLFLQKAE